MKKSKKITNEELAKHFSNPFELVNHAIDLARHLIHSGHELSETNDRNSASIVLKKVLKERDDEEKGEDLIEVEKKISPSDHDNLNPLQQAI